MIVNRQERSTISPHEAAARIVALANREQIPIPEARMRLRGEFAFSPEDAEELLNIGLDPG